MKEKFEMPTEGLWNDLDKLGKSLRFHATFSNKLMRYSGSNFIKNYLTVNKLMDHIEFQIIIQKLIFLFFRFRNDFITYFIMFERIFHVSVILFVVFMTSFLE